MQAWRHETLSKRDFWYFPLNFATFPILRKTYFVENLRTADLTLLEELFCRKNMVMNFWKMVTRIRYYKKREAIEKEKIFHLLIEFLLYLRITTWYICGKFLVNFMREKIIFERNNEKFYNLVYLRLLFGLSSRFFTTRMIPYTSRHTTSFQRTSIRRRQRRIDVETTSCVYWDRRCSSYQFLNQSLQTVMSWKNCIFSYNDPIQRAKYLRKLNFIGSACLCIVTECEDMQAEAITFPYWTHTMHTIKG